MMRKLCLINLVLLTAIFCGCSRTTVPQIILDTDIGNDIDDTEALDMLYKYMDEGRADLLGICLNKIGFETARFVDIMGCWYGYPDIPVGMIRTDKSTGNSSDKCYTGQVCGMTSDDGAPLFKFKKEGYDDMFEAFKLYRQLLSEAKDKSVTIVSIGFLNNLSLLIDSAPDEISSMSGKELIERKVKQLVIMAGRFIDDKPEYNVVIDVPAAQKLFSEWPGEIVLSPWEIGMKVRYPASSIEDDFNWTAAHPLKEAYIRYLNMPYDNAMFDPTAVVYAVGDTDKFTVSEPGFVRVDDKGVSAFTAYENGNARILSVNDEQCSVLVDYFKNYLTKRPKIRENMP